MQLIHNSFERIYRSPFGAVPIHTSLTLALHWKDAVPGYSCCLRLWRNETGEQLIPMSEQALADGTLRFSCSFSVPETPCLLWYAFRLTAPDGQISYYCADPTGPGGIGKLCTRLQDSYQITVYRPAPVPEWYRHAVVYQIFPDRFARGSDYLARFQAASALPHRGPRRILQADWDDTPFYTRDANREITRWCFFGGTLEGIRSHLDYLQELGITAIYLNPIFKAASNHKYDTADYLQIDPGFGDEQSFRRLADAAESRGMHLILDGVFSHTGADSIYFNRDQNYESIGACQGEESPYYGWYRFQQFPNDYDCWWGVKDLPNVNELDETYQDFIYRAPDSVIRHWLRCGAKGWRLDVADELPDSFIAGIRRAIKEEDPEALLLGEVWEDASNKISYGVQRQYLFGNELDATMHYPFRTLMLDFFCFRKDAAAVQAALMLLKEHYPPEHYRAVLNLIGSHDRKRILSMLGGALDDAPITSPLTEKQRTTARERLMALTTLQFTALGVPCIYYGDEAGMEGGDDPENRAPFPWGHEDAALMAHYRALIALRQRSKVLQDGEDQPMSFGSEVFGYLRTLHTEQLLSLASRSSQPQAVLLPAAADALLFGSGVLQERSVTLPPYGYAILHLRKDARCTESSSG